MEKDDVVIDSNGNEYRLIKRLGKGGHSEVWKVQDVVSKSFFAYKECKHVNRFIKDSILELIHIGKFKDLHGNPVDDIVLPIAVVECDDGTFGYIMELENLQEYTTLKKIWCGKYPSCVAICKIVQNLARVFEALNIVGMSFMDIDESSFYFNLNNGDVRVFNIDNIVNRDRIANVSI